MNIATQVTKAHSRIHFLFPKVFQSITRCVLRNSFSSLCKTDYEKYSDETLDTISEYFENVAEFDKVPDEFDVSLESGVLTIHVSKLIGTYVINKQAPNMQIWLSSPMSGPKRYDFKNNTWVYAHDGKYLHQLLEEEFSKHFTSNVDLSHLPYYYKKSSE